MVNKKLYAVIVVAMLVAYVAGLATPRPYISALDGEQPAKATCPAGSYDIGITKDGQSICKLEPTGCPYGDSIPLDSPKCAPPTNPDAYAPWQPEVAQPIEQAQPVVEEGCK